jgi:hypothetical protein
MSAPADLLLASRVTSKGLERFEESCDERGVVSCRENVFLVFLIESIVSFSLSR